MSAITAELERLYRAEVEYFAEKLRPEIEAGDYAQDDADGLPPLDAMALRLEKDPELGTPGALRRAALIVAAAPGLAAALETEAIDGAANDQIFPALAGWCIAEEIFRRPNLAHLLGREGA